MVVPNDEDGIEKAIRTIIKGNIEKVIRVMIINIQ